jgi:hypothetical protein
MPSGGHHIVWGAAWLVVGLGVVYFGYKQFSS